ncbi:hypothetical protein EVAR_31031_1 [Eumeta japonica]|uniref:Uncharacterized protein n=1 Tax=Eumeta variegata TaxID=151549 RepID=A0A4C1VEK0_EUMVA|nr:hypothetical protein EVAR_31031_1 [Eumeta japonica]
MERAGVNGGGLCGDEGEVGHKNSHSLDETQQRKGKCYFSPVFYESVISTKTSSHNRSYSSTRSHLAIDSYRYSCEAGYGSLV